MSSVNHDQVEQSELQLQQFFLVEEQLKTLGLGLSKEMATKSATQLAENIKLVEMKEPGLTESHFGRKLYGHVKTIFSNFNLGKVLSEVVESNYSIERYSAKLQDELIGLKGKRQELEAPRVNPPKSMEMYMIYAEREYEKLLEAERGDTERPGVRRSKGKKKSADGDVPGEADLTGDEAEEDERYKAIKKKYRFQYADDDAAYDKYLIHCEQVKASEALLIETENRTLVISIMVDGIRAACNVLVQKIQGAVMPYDKVKQKLSGVVVLDRTGETIANPFESNNLAGMVNILKSEYYTASLIQFNNDFADTLRCSIPAQEVLVNPMKAVQLTDKRIAEWTTMNYWKYMTMDIFFVNILLGYIPGGSCNPGASTLKDKCVVAVEEFIQKRETAGDWNEAYSQISQGGGASAMPIYRFLADFIRRAENSSKHRSIVGTGAPGLTQQSGNSKLGNSKDSYQATNRRFTGNVEAAAAAGTQYTSVVPREQLVTIKDIETGREYPYTATKEVCSVCYGKPDQAQQDSHFAKLSAKCYKGTCRSCGLFGHKSANCQQHPCSHVHSKQGEK